MHTGAEDFGVTNDAGIHWVSVTETYWGYVIRSETNWSTRARLIERVSAAAGVALLTLAFGNWLAPDLLAMANIRSPQVASSAGMGVAGLALVWVAGRGLSRELHVDLTMRSLRQVVRNRNGRTRIDRVVPFSAIESAFVRRASVPGGAARLYLRLKEGGKLLHVASGRQATLEVLNARMSQDLKPVLVQMEGWQRVGRKLMPVAQGEPAVS
ncbi:MAG: hypothetical protein ACP5DX_13755 [Paracoccaceae bacterium]